MALRSEDLDRRVTILNKWWTGQLEMLKGKNNQSISGIDRPVFLEGVTGIMMRSEWRQPPYSTTMLSDNLAAPQSTMPTSVSTTSLDSGASDFISESIQHNVRTLFVQNLLSQMAFVVERMSMRNAPASLVAFCGKTCAYAFLFCPGVADVLVQLWRPSAEALRRTLAELGCPRGFKLGPDSMAVALRFPAAVRSLAAETHTALTKSRRRKVPLPLAAGPIRWYGPWIGRWNGRDSDLFFTFTKYYHLLASEMLPRPADKTIRAGVPGLVFVHAQILHCLESTLYRQGSQQQHDPAASPVADDMDSPDAALAMPHTAANATRTMAENRLIMLLNDLLSRTNPEHHHLRVFFAESCGDIFKAAAKKISIYDHDACFVLCDFVEELLPIISRYDQANPENVGLDWSFWLDVFHRMLESDNTLTEVRLFAFLYSTWNTLIANEDRRKDICLNWLLESSFFEKFFNHWCPMVRAYFHRLLCWRVARCDSEVGESDALVYETLLRRLEATWSVYSSLREAAEGDERRTSPSSAPCSPAPGRRLVIIRDETANFPVSMFTSFDTVLSQMSSTLPANTDSRDTDSAGKDRTNRPVSRKRWNFIKNIIPFSGPGNSRPGEVTPPGSADSTSTTDSDVPGTADSTSTQQNAATFAEESAKRTSPRRRPSTPPHQSFCFKFSLEWLDGPGRQSKDRELSWPQLPPAAHAVVETRREQRNESEAGGEGDRGDAAGKLPAISMSSAGRYGGRALAEWAQLVAEYECFFERRRDEGVPLDRLVETPSLGVESFRMSG